MKATRTRHGLVFVHRPTLTLQLHNFELFRTCRTSSFCTDAWQLARFQLTRRIARSLGDSWASCILKSSAHSYMSLAVAWADGWRSVRTSTVVGLFMAPKKWADGWRKVKLLWPFVRLLLTAYCHFLATLRQPLFGVFLFLHCPSLPSHLKN